jgi:hypothetical protein
MRDDRSLFIIQDVNFNPTPYNSICTPGSFNQAWLPGENRAGSKTGFFNTDNSETSPFAPPR